MKKYNFLYKQNGKAEKLVIEADNIEEGEALCRSYCEIFGCGFINLSPTVFDIRGYIKQSNDGENIMPHPHIYGRMIEQQALRMERKKQEESAPKTESVKVTK